MCFTTATWQNMGKPCCACHAIQPVVPPLQVCKCRSKGFGSSTLTCIQCKNAYLLRLPSQSLVREGLRKVLFTWPILDIHF